MRWKRQECILLWESKFDTKQKRKRNGRWRKGSKRNYFIVFTDQQSLNGLAKCLYLHVLTKVQSNYQLGAALCDRTERAQLLLSTFFQFLPWQPLHRAAHNMAAASQQVKQVKNRERSTGGKPEPHITTWLIWDVTLSCVFHVVSARSKSVLVQIRDYKRLDSRSLYAGRPVRRARWLGGRRWRSLPPTFSLRSKLLLLKALLAELNQ